MKLQNVLKGRSPEIGPIDRNNKLPAMMLNSDGRNPDVSTMPSSSASSITGSDRILKPTQYDVVFGRGKPFQGHAGNIRLHMIVDGYKARYSKARRNEKTEIAKEIVRSIKNDKEKPGRFLRLAGGGEEGWEQVSDTIARDKVSHALRGKPHHDRKEAGATTNKCNVQNSPSPKKRKTNASSPQKMKQALKKEEERHVQQNKRQKMLPGTSSTTSISTSDTEILSPFRSSPPATTVFSQVSPNFGYDKTPLLRDLKSERLASALASDNSNIGLSNIMMMFNNQNRSSQLGSLQSMLGQRSSMLCRNVGLVPRFSPSLVAANNYIRMTEIRSAQQASELLPRSPHFSFW